VVSLFIYISSLYRLALFSIFRTHGTRTSEAGIPCYFGSRCNSYRNSAAVSVEERACSAFRWSWCDAPNGAASFTSQKERPPEWRPLGFSNVWSVARRSRHRL